MANGFLAAATGRLSVAQKHARLHYLMHGDFRSSHRRWADDERGHVLLNPVRRQLRGGLGLRLTVKDAARGDPIIALDHDVIGDKAGRLADPGHKACLRLPRTLGRHTWFDLIVREGWRTWFALLV